MTLPKRSELKDFDIKRDITVSRNGDGSFYALFGADMPSGIAGFGETEMAATAELNRQPAFNKCSDAKTFKVSEND